MSYTIEILRSAQKSLEKIGPRDGERIIAAVDKLAVDPRPSGCRKLTGRSAWRIRVGAFRVIYEVYDHKLVVLVVDIGNRRDVYRSQ